MTNLDTLLKSREIALLTKVHLIKGMVFPVVMYGCESWTVKKAELNLNWIESCSVISDSLQPQVHGILQARILEWVAFPFSRGSSQPSDQIQVFPVSSTGKESACNAETPVQFLGQETWVQSLGWEDPLEKGKATHSSILAWRIPWTIWFMGS